MTPRFTPSPAPFFRFALPHPRQWLETPDAESRIRLLKKSKPDLRSEERIAEAVENFYFSVLLSRALTILNANAQFDEDGDPFLSADTAYLPVKLQRDAIAAGKKSGVRFRPGRHRPRHTIDGDLPFRWLVRSSHSVADLAVSYWKPHEGIPIWAARSNAGSNSRRAATVLPPGSIKALQEMGYTRSAIARARKRAKEAGS